MTADGLFSSDQGFDKILNFGVESCEEFIVTKLVRGGYTRNTLCRKDLRNLKYNNSWKFLI